MSTVEMQTAHRAYGVSDDHAPWCREVVNFEERQDSVPVLNGVAVGQRWQNIHTDEVKTVTQIRLAGVGANTAHYESIVLLSDDQDPNLFDSGQCLWSLVEHWRRVDGEQPEVWPSRAEIPEAWLVSRVRHTRPSGASVAWIGERNTRWRYYDNGVLTCDGLVVDRVVGQLENPDATLLARNPLSAPGPAAAREANLTAAVGSLAERWKRRNAA